MQYLLTEEEYNTLHGEGDDEMDALEIELLHLKADIRQFFYAVKDMNIMLGPKGERLDIGILLSEIPTNIQKELANVYPAFKS